VSRAKSCLPGLVLGLTCCLAEVARAECPAPVTASELAQLVSLGDAAFADMDADTFSELRMKVIQGIPCLSDELNQTQVAALHRMQALAAFLDRDPAASVGYFRSLLAVAPGYELPEALAPEGHPLRLYFEVAAGTFSPPTVPIEAPRSGAVFVDGKVATQAPIDRPYLFQYSDEAGKVTTSALVRPGLDPPTYPAHSPRDRKEARVNLPLATTAGLAALASGGLYLAASHSESTFWDPATSDADLEALRKRTNTMGWLSAGVGVVAVGTGAAAFLVTSW